MCPNGTVLLNFGGPNESFCPHRVVRNGKLKMSVLFVSLYLAIHRLNIVFPFFPLLFIFFFYHLTNKQFSQLENLQESWDYINMA